MHANYIENGNIYTEGQKNSLEALTVLCVECIMIVRMTLCSLDWVSVLCVATCVNKVTYAGCVYKLKCLPIVYVTIFFYYSHTLRSIITCIIPCLAITLFINT